MNKPPDNDEFPLSLIGSILVIQTLVLWLLTIYGCMPPSH